MGTPVGQGLNQVVPPPRRFWDKEQITAAEHNKEVSRDIVKYNINLRNAKIKQAQNAQDKTILEGVTYLNGKKKISQGEADYIMAKIAKQNGLS